MNGDLSLGLELLLTAFTILYIANLLFPVFGTGNGTTSHRMEKRSLLNQHVARRPLAIR